MQLKDYLSEWPPSWGGYYGRGSNIQTPVEAILTSVKQFERNQTITLVVSHEDQEAEGTITEEDSEFRLRLLKVFQKNIGRSIKKIGSVDIQLP